jgi:hypothetical protein
MSHGNLTSSSERGVKRGYTHIEHCLQCSGSLKAPQFELLLEQERATTNLVNFGFVKGEWIEGHMRMLTTRVVAFITKNWVAAACMLQ